MLKSEGEVEEEREDEIEEEGNEAAEMMDPDAVPMDEYEEEFNRNN